MKHILLLLFLFVLNNILIAQEYAVFSSETTRLRHMYLKNDGQLPNRIKEKVWYINGQEMRYGSGTIKVKVNPDKLDTILYKNTANASFDTIICSISTPGTYTFYYNACCGAFNIFDETNNKFIQGKVIYQIVNPDGNTYLGTLGESGIIADSETSDTLHIDCRSAMSPNVYKLSLSQIMPFDNTSDFVESTCLQENNEVNWDFQYTTKAKKMDILFMPLNKEPLTVIYDTKTGLITIDGK